MLVADPQTFEKAALLAECIVWTYGEAAHGGPAPMDPRAIHDNGNGSRNNPGIGGSMANNYECTQGTQGNN